ncbi:MAG: GNAT family N-acetyltransferase [Infirmifilum sp.]
MPPRSGNHIVILASLNDLPVGIAYLNKNNFNIDYGIHVINSFWRNRIGTRILNEALGIARQLGVKYIGIELRGDPF